MEIEIRVVFRSGRQEQQLDARFGIGHPFMLGREDLQRVGVRGSARYPREKEQKCRAETEHDSMVWRRANAGCKFHAVAVATP